MNLTPPKQYQVGYTEFYGLKFKLTPDVLIPRPETELMVDMALTALGNPAKPGSIVLEPLSLSGVPTLVDVGTGSGCIPISIAKNNSQVKLIGIDVSSKALEVAKKNAQLHHASKRIFFLENDLLAHFKQSPDIITANLPYIPTARLMHIDPMVRDFEPRLALDGGYDGFELYRKLFSQMRDQKVIPKLFIGEIDDEQHDIALAEAKRYFPAAKAEIKKDLAKKDRFLVITFHNLANDLH